MTGIRAVLSDRRRRQKGSVLSGLLMIVAMLAILIGALMTELSSSFLASRAATTRIANEATLNSAVELALNWLQAGPVPAVCARDARGPWYLALNNKTAAVTQTCTAIVPDQTSVLAPGGYMVDGVRETLVGFSDYIVGNQNGLVTAYGLGGSSLDWSFNAGGAITAPVQTQPDVDDYGHVALLVPNAGSRSTCRSHCVSLYDQSAGVTPPFKCDMAAAGQVLAAPAAELAPAGYSPRFPAYTFFGDAAGRIHVFDAASDGVCAPVADAGDMSGAPVVGQPLVFTGTVTTTHGITTSRADIFLVTSDASGAQLEHWQYVETGGTQGSLVPMSSLPLAVGGSASASRPSGAVPAIGSSISLAVAGLSGGLQVVRISAAWSKSGPTYGALAGATASVPPNVTRAPYWCHCPSGDVIGVGDTNGTLYLLDGGLNPVWHYDGIADGTPAINTTPVADANNDWYFGADDGYVYDVEIPVSGAQMFKAARFGPGGAIRSSPVEVDCSSGPCLYFASTTSGGYFVRLGSTRVSDLRACVTSSPGALACAVNPRLWARVTVGPPSVVGGQGISVSGWSYYSPP